MESKDRKKTYNLAHEVLSHMFTKALQWGLIKSHPMSGGQVQKFSLPPRNRYVEDWEVREFLSVASPFLISYVKLKGLTGLDKGDMLSILTSGIGPLGLTVAARKKTSPKSGSGRERFFPFKDEKGHTTGVEEALEEVLSLEGRPGSSKYLFCTTRGKNRGSPYVKENGTTNGFDSIWQRTMARALEETKLTKRFTEHDLRAKVGSDAVSDEDAQRQLDHASIRTTRNVYRRKAVTMPVAKGFK